MTPTFHILEEYRVTGTNGPIQRDQMNLFFMGQHYHSVMQL